MKEGTLIAAPDSGSTVRKPELRQNDPGAQEDRPKQRQR